MVIIDAEVYYSGLRCSACGAPYDIGSVQSFSSCCQKPLVVEYQLDDHLEKSELLSLSSMWRYQRFMPIFEPGHIVSLGEGMTPILPLKTLTRIHGLSDVRVKDESLNPTGSFKSRGMSAAVSKAKELGIKQCIVPTAGNAGGAMAAYCASAGIEATVVMPRYTPDTFRNECKHYGAKVIDIDGFIDKCGEVASELAQEQGLFNMATMKEPFRLEGKKTMGYEIAEQYDWQLPEVILYPAGGGTGYIGIWKAFQELRRLGWIGDKLPKMIAVQSENCSPIVDQYQGKEVDLNNYTESIANGLVVPKAFAMDMIMTVLVESRGSALTVSDNDMRASMKELSAKEGMIVSPEGAALWSGLLQLIDDGTVSKEERILLINTGSGYKYFDHFN